MDNFLQHTLISWKIFCTFHCATKNSPKNDYVEFKENCFNLSLS